MLKNLKQRIKKKLTNIAFSLSYFRPVHIHPDNELGLCHVLKSGRIRDDKAKRTFRIEHLLDSFENNDMSKKYCSCGSSPIIKITF